VVNQAVRKRLQIFFIFLIFFSSFTKTHVTSWNDASRMATIESLVDFHTFIIDNSSFFSTGDKYFYQNHFYSDKPPVLALYSSIFYLLLKITFGLSFASHPSLTYYLLTVLVVGVTSSLGLVCLGEILNIFRIEPNWSNIILLIAGTGTLILPYSVVFNNHVVSGSLLLFSFYYLLLKQETTINAAISGFFISLAGSIDITIFTLIPLFFVLFISKSGKTIFAFNLSCVPMTVVYILINIYTSGNIIPPAMNASLWDYVGSSFGEKNLSGLVEHDVLGLITYAFNMLIGSRGLLSYSPVILFSIYSGIKIFFQPGFKYKKEYFFLAITCIVFVIFYIWRTNNYSGYSYGVRWFASIMLLGCIPLAHVAEEARTKHFGSLFVMITSISIFISFIGLIAPWGGIPENGYSSFFLNLELLRQQTFLERLKLFLALVTVYGVFYHLFKKFDSSQERKQDKLHIQKRGY
jgi:hypothetical protein